MQTLGICCSFELSLETIGSPVREGGRTSWALSVWKNPSGCKADCALCGERGWEGGQQIHPEASQEVQLAGFMLISYSERCRGVQRHPDLCLMCLARERGPHLKSWIAKRGRNLWSGCTLAIEIRGLWPTWVDVQGLWQQRLEDQVILCCGTLDWGVVAVTVLVIHDSPDLSWLFPLRTVYRDWTDLDLLWCGSV